MEQKLSSYSTQATEGEDNFDDDDNNDISFEFIVDDVRCELYEVFRKFAKSFITNFTRLKYYISMVPNIDQKEIKDYLFCERAYEFLVMVIVDYKFNEYSVDQMLVSIERAKYFKYVLKDIFDFYNEYVFKLYEGSRKVITMI